MRGIALAFGTAFGLVLAWAGTMYPDTIRAMLLLQSARLYLLMASAVAVAFVGLRVLRALGAHTLLGHETVAWQTAAPERRHVVGAAIFGAGWAVSDACPGPLAVQLGTGVGWALATAAGVVLGVLAHERLRESATRRAPEPRPRAGERDRIAVLD